MIRKGRKVTKNLIYSVCDLRRKTNVRKLSQHEVARRLSISQATVCKCEAMQEYAQEYANDCVKEIEDKYINILKSIKLEAIEANKKINYILNDTTYDTDIDPRQHIKALIKILNKFV